MKSNKTQFEKASSQCMDALYTRALRLTKSAPKAEELVQLTYLRAYSAFKELNVRIEFQTWILALLNDIHQELTTDTFKSQQKTAAAH